MSIYLRGRESLRSARPMGASLSAGGAVFRVWAPDADEVYVAGSFNAWWPRAHALFPEGDGTWSRAVPGVSVGDQYRYVLVNGASELWRVDPYAREFTAQQGDAVIPESEFEWGPTRRPEWPRSHWVVYRLHVPTFDVEPGSGQGTLDRALGRLGYLAELGVNVIELAPLAERLEDGEPRYGVVQPFGVESLHGGVLALKRFVATAHELEMRVLLEVAYDHFEPSDAHLWQFDAAPGSGSDLGRTAQPDPARPMRPNHARPELRRYLLDSALSWIEEYRLDGLCVQQMSPSRAGADTLGPGHEVPPPAPEPAESYGLLRALNNELEVRYPGTITVAHEPHPEPRLTRPLAEGGAGFGAQRDDRLQRCMAELMQAANPAEAEAALVTLQAALRVPGAEAFRRFINVEFSPLSAYRLALPDELWPGRAQPWAAERQVLLGAALLLTAPGVPLIQQGQELGQDGERVPVQWDRAALASPVQCGWARLLRLRRNLDGSTRGLLGVRVHVQRADPRLKFLAYHRWDAGGPRDSTVILFNASRHASVLRVGLPRAGTWRPRFYSGSRELDPVLGRDPPPEVNAEPVEQDGNAFSARVALAAYSAMLLSQDAE